MMKYCDKCNAKIINNKCTCGLWFDKKNPPKEIRAFEEAVLQFNKLNQYIVSMDHFSGSCLIIFKGNYTDCVEAKKLIEEKILNKRF